MKLTSEILVKIFEYAHHVLADYVCSMWRSAWCVWMKRLKNKNVSLLILKGYINNNLFTRESIFTINPINNMIVVAKSDGFIVSGHFENLIDENECYPFFEEKDQIKTPSGLNLDVFFYKNKLFLLQSFGVYQWFNGEWQYDDFRFLKSSVGFDFRENIVLFVDYRVYLFSKTKKGRWRITSWTSDDLEIPMYFSDPRNITPCILSKSAFSLLDTKENVILVVSFEEGVICHMQLKEPLSIKNVYSNHAQQLYILKCWSRHESCFLKIDLKSKTMHQIATWTPFAKHKSSIISNGNFIVATAGQLQIYRILGEFSKETS